MIPRETRRRAMGILARSDAKELEAAFERLDVAPEGVWLRSPEVGIVMVRGRTGGSGAPFNLGEMTVTRASYQLVLGTVGHATVAGRDPAKARIAAILDALLQTDDGAAVRAEVIEPLAAAEAEARARARAETAATKVEFFTMERGDD